jgi:hypothetical protein
MKHLSHKLAVSLLATSVTLSSVNADRPLLEVPSVVSFHSITKDSVQRAHQPRLNSPQSIIRSLRAGEAQLEKALLSGAAAQDEVVTLTILYNDLRTQFDNLSDEAKQLKIENAALKLEQEEHKAEKKSTWERIKNWIFKLDVTKVSTTVITSLVTLICTLLVIIL